MAVRARIRTTAIARAHEQPGLGGSVPAAAAPTTVLAVAGTGKGF